MGSSNKKFHADRLSFAADANALARRGARQVVLTLACTGASVCASTQSDTGSVASDAAAPTFAIDVQSAAGEQVTMRGQRSTDVLVLPFWKTTCTPCKAQLADFDALLANYGPRGLYMWAVNVDGPKTRSSVEGWIERGQWSFETVMDAETELFSRYNPKGECPFYVVLAADGTVLRSHGGYVKGETDQLAAFLDEKLPK